MFGHWIVLVFDVPKLVPITNAETATAAKIKTRRYLFRIVYWISDI